MSSWRVFFAAVLCVTALVVLARTLYANRLRYREPDFNHYYRNTLRLHAGTNIWRNQIEVLHRHPNAVALVLYPPAFYALFTPLVSLPPRPAYWLWQSFQLAALLGAVMVTIGEALPTVSLADRATVAALCLLFPQTYGTLYDSQPTFLILLLLIGAFAMDRRGFSGASGFAIAAAALLKIFPGVTVGYFLVRRRWRTVFWAVLWALVGGVMLAGLYGIDAIVDFFVAGRLSMSPYWMRLDRNVTVHCNLYALLAAFAPNGSPPAPETPVLTLLTLVADSLLLALTTRACLRNPSQGSDRLGEGLAFGAWLATAILVSPTGWAHYAVLLIPFYIFVGALLVAGYRPPLPYLLLVGFGVAGFVVPYFWKPLRALHAYFFALLTTHAGACLLAAWKSQLAWDQRSKSPSHSRPSGQLLS